jgi:hypothetical protein
MEWNFFSTMLQLEYVREDGMLAVPFNLIPKPRDFVACFKRFKACITKSNNGIADACASKKAQEQKKLDVC